MEAALSTFYFFPSGFATFLEQKGKDAVDPEVSSEERFQLEGVHASMALDAVPAMTVPVQYDIPNTRYDVRKRTPKKDFLKHFWIECFSFGRTFSTLT